METNKEEKEIEKALKQYEEVKDCLVDFIKRASKEGARPEEIAILPDVVEIVFNRL